MTTDLVTWIEERLNADTNLDDEVGLLVLAALEGESQLDAYLERGETTVISRSEADDSPAAVATGAFLKAVEVTGFRGIGARVRLDLEPSPGLTVVAGRNGSGKSSLAEAFEVLLTGGTYRWKAKKSAQWSESWRNLHHDGPVEVTAEVIEEGSGLTAIRSRWADSATDISERTTVVHRTEGGTRGPAQDVTVLGWAGPLETFRPMLSYEELGGLLEAGPSELYDALAKVLGMEQLSDALRRIQARHKELKQPGTSVGALRRSLAEEVAALSDDRASAVAPLLKKTAPDTRAIRDLATGVTAPDQGALASLRALANLTAPDAEAVGRAAYRLRSAVARMAEVGETESARQVARLDLRVRAVRLHQEHGDQSCPVCAKGTLDESWAGAAKSLNTHEETALLELREAAAELEQARSGARKQLTRRPAPLDRAATPELEQPVSAARESWDNFCAAPESDLALADHLELHVADVESAVAILRSAAAAALTEKDDAWAPLAARIASWCQEWEDWLNSKPRVDRLASAEKWLKDNDTTLKNQRIAPISTQAKHAWSVLRQESNVELGDLRLEGQATRRRVTIPATIDGVETSGALPVMSQGELHALALSLFLPRASLPESPFRFIVLDDPIQAMDPAKVDGFVDLLTELARTRQVIVFSHDDRLPAALRRRQATARILEVSRGKESVVSIAAADDPAKRYLDDARALALDVGVPDETTRRTLPGLLRMALESVARDRFFAQRLSAGVSLSDVEDAWTSARATRDRVSLAVYDDVRSLDGWLRGESRKVALGCATSGMHHGLHAHTNPGDAVHHASRVVADIRSGAK